MAGHAQTAARMIAAGRVLVGAVMFTSPDLVAAPWVGDDARTDGARLVVRALGARDAALGAGTLAAAGDDGAHLRRWLLASSASDAADFVATLAGPRTPARKAVLGLAAASAVAGVIAAASV
jgi:hypothetical protein